MTDVDQHRDEFVERLFSAGLGMAEVLTVYLGDTSGSIGLLSGRVR